MKPLPMIALALLVACSKFNGPANPENTPWPVICEGGGRCMVDYECRPGGKCRPVPGPFGADRDGGTPRDTREVPQHYD